MILAELTAKQRASIAHLIASPCKNGHSRHDAFVYLRAGDALSLQCRKCTSDRVHVARHGPPAEELARLERAVARMTQRIAELRQMLNP